ncbi:serine/threonine-protein kinase [Streptomyces uncialis]|uniref:serine/threonine-protein kinase n=1 Tax=Streptomyces uncialis TaxID=1048205 RepID=UPI003828398B
MGTVWHARDEVLHREVAVKEVRAPAGLPAAEVARLHTRLEREAWAAARVSHRGVVTVHDVAVDGGRPWIVMELVRGLALSDVLDAEGPMPPQRAARIGAEALNALRAAHAAGVLHRDIKPGNVLIGNDGRVVLSDFGIATVEGTSALTMTGEIIGSPEFLAPERALGRPPGPESDLWSLGVLLYAAVEGNSPFRRTTPLSTLRAVVDDALPPPRNAGPLAPVIAGLLRKDPAERTPAEAAERQLRIVAAGGEPTAAVPHATGAVPAAAPVAAHVSPYPDGPDRAPSPLPPPASPGDGPAPTAGTPGDRGNRAVLVLAAALTALALAAGGLTYALLNREDGGGGNGGDGSGASAAGATVGSKDTDGSGSADGGGDGSADGGGDGNADGGGEGASGSGGSGGSKSTTGSGTPGSGGGSGEGGNPSGSGGSGGTSAPAQRVGIELRGVRTEYTGQCPGPETQAPEFEAAFTAARVPTTVEYRWVTRSGQSSDPGWKALTFPADGDLTRRVEHRERFRRDTGATYRDAVRVEVRAPVREESDEVAFTVTCAREVPSTDGTPTAPESG